MVTDSAGREGWRMTGSAGTAKGVTFCLFIQWGGGLGEGVCAILRERRLADDGKRLPSDGRFMFRAIAFIVQGFGEGIAQRFSSDPRLADDGKRLPSDGRFRCRAIAFIG